MKEETIYSYHIFYFPFKWEMKYGKDELFEKQVSLKNIQAATHSSWQRTTERPTPREKQELFNEKNYYYEFVHNVLYDSGTEQTLIKHYERNEFLRTKHSITYNIDIRKKKTYSLEADDIALNFYSTGVGTLIFYLKNTQEDQASLTDIKLINQYGRRVMPPFYADIEYRNEIAERIFIEGLNGSRSYSEDFNSYATGYQTWKPASFILTLIDDLSPEVEVVPVIDDRMIVCCWYANDEMAEQVKTNPDEFIMSDDWYSLIFVDSGSPSCENMSMRKELVRTSSNMRWQDQGTAYGITRYSFMILGEKHLFFQNIILTHVRTIYSRMMELILVQRASVLKFSQARAKLNLKVTSTEKQYRVQKIADLIGSLYKEYIRFVNHMYFREVTIQDQGIDFYKIMHEKSEMQSHLTDLSTQLLENYNYVALLNNEKRERAIYRLNILAIIFLPATVVSSVFGMNALPPISLTFGVELIIIIIVVLLSIGMSAILFTRK